MDRLKSGAEPLLIEEVDDIYFVRAASRIVKGREMTSACRQDTLNRYLVDHSLTYAKRVETS